MTSSAPQGVVTVLVTRRVTAASRAPLEATLRDMTRHATTFEGHLGVSVRMPEGAGLVEILFRFSDQRLLDAWREDPETSRLLAELDARTAGEPTVRILSGLETWFTVPNRPGRVPPPKGKMFLVTWAALYPVVLGLTELLGPHLALLPSPLRPLVVTGLAVFLMTFVVMPRVTRLIHGWLFPKNEDE